MPNLFPANVPIISDAEITRTPDAYIGYRKSVNVSPETGGVMMDGNGKVLYASPVETWVQWCIKQCETPRFKCDAYTTDEGINLDEIFNAETREEAEALLFSEISEALMADTYGRTAYVESVECEWIAPDSVNVTVTAVGIDGETATFGAAVKNI